tara:strand:+ start:581 stop:1552 length:972 start_codon:yes stop_codon:yes gene_type:complete
MKYLLVDSANLFFRARHVVRGDIDTKTGMCLHIIFQAINSIYKKFGGQVVFFFEGRSWRKDHYKQYKLNRKELRDAFNEKEAEEDRIFWQTFDAFYTFLSDKTNCVVCQHDNLEADDLIAGWIKNNDTDEHVIVSSDSDFYQLINSHVSQYNSITDTLINNAGHFVFRTMKPVLNKKTKELLSAPDPEWILFEKCMRGDSTDNIFSAYPGVRTKGSKNKIGLLEAFADKDKKGYAWNNLMLQRWVDHEGQEHRVLDCYNRNKMLIDLNAQPNDIKIQIDECISLSKKKEQISQVGIHLMRFCGKHNLVKIGEQVNDHVKYLNK